jgi:hypothetical protein
MPFVASQAVNVGIPVYLAVTGELWLVAALAVAGGAGQFIGVVALGSVLRTVALTRRAAAQWTAAWMVAAWSVLALAVFTSGTVREVLLLAGAAAMGALWGVLSVRNRAAAALGGEAGLRLAGPAGRVAAAVGSLVGAAVGVAGGGWMWALAVLVCASAISPALAPRPPGVQLTLGGGDGRRGWSWPVFWWSAAVVLVGYGPVAIYVALVAVTAGPAWAGVAMVAYAGGAVLAPVLARHTGRWWNRDPLAALLLGAGGNVLWLATLVHPVVGVLVARFGSGALLMWAEGSLEWEAHRQDVLPSVFAARAAAVVFASAGASALLLWSGSAVVVGAGCAAAAVVLAGAVWAGRRLAGWPMGGR